MVDSLPSIKLRSDERFLLAIPGQHALRICVEVPQGFVHDLDQLFKRNRERYIHLRRADPAADCTLELRNVILEAASKRVVRDVLDAHSMVETIKNLVHKNAHLLVGKITSAACRKHSAQIDLARHANKTP